MTHSPEVGAETQRRNLDCVSLALIYDCSVFTEIYILGFVHAHFLFISERFLNKIMFPGMPKFPGEDFINSFYPILIALVLGLILGFRFVLRNGTPVARPVDI